MDAPVIRLEEVRKVYPRPAGDVVALNGVTLSIEEGEFVAIMGASGSGKSTLLTSAAAWHGTTWVLRPQRRHRYTGSQCSGGER